MVHTSGACHWMKGRRRTGLGMGMAVRPPVVWTKRIHDSPRSGSRWMSGSATAWKVWRRPTSLSLVTPISPPPS